MTRKDSEGGEPRKDGLTQYRDRLRKTPHMLVPGVMSWVNGWYYRIKFFLQFRKFSAGKFFRVYGPLVVSGPGKVEFGDNCLIISNAIKPVCLRTLSVNAAIVIENDVGLNGTSIQCVERVKIGQLSNIADAYITDTRAHSIAKNRRLQSVEDVPPRPVTIERNVWISVSVVVLDGVTIGENSVIGACSLVRKDVPANVFAAGNPLSILRDIPD